MSAFDAVAPSFDGHRAIPQAAADAVRAAIIAALNPNTQGPNSVAKPQFSVNGRLNPVVKMRPGEVHQATNNAHPFHIHINPFQITEVFAERVCHGELQRGEGQRLPAGDSELRRVPERRLHFDDTGALQNAQPLRRFPRHLRPAPSHPHPRRPGMMQLVRVVERLENLPAKPPYSHH
jgi:hypothetical protein